MIETTTTARTGEASETTTTSSYRPARRRRRPPARAVTTTGEGLAGRQGEKGGTEKVDIRWTEKADKGGCWW
jgi:hypothetical protein